MTAVKTPSLNPGPLKERMKMPRQHMLEQPAEFNRKLREVLKEFAAGK